MLLRVGRARKGDENGGLLYDLGWSGGRMVLDVVSFKVGRVYHGG